MGPNKPERGNSDHGGDEFVPRGLYIELIGVVGLRGG